MIWISMSMWSLSFLMPSLFTPLSPIDVTFPVAVGEIWEGKKTEIQESVAGTGRGQLGKSWKDGLNFPQRFGT